MDSLTASLEIKRILNEGDKEDIRSLFAFDSTNSDESVLLRFRLWTAKFFPQYFKVEDAPFHADIDKNNLAVYRDEISEFIDGAFRGAAKTVRTKLMIAFLIANDIEHSKRYFKIATKDIANAKKIVTDIYNMLAVGEIRYYYPEIFTKTPEKRQETMGVFTTATGVMVLATTVGVDQRGQLQEDARPDFLWLDDIETRKTLRSAVETNAIWDNINEALDGMAKARSGVVVTCNYISERGNVHKLVQPADGRVIMLTPIIDKDGMIAWPAKYTMEDINRLKNNPDVDFAGEYMNQPSAGYDVYFDRASIDRQVKKQPIKEVAGLKIFHEYNASHRFGSGADVGGGVGLDSSTNVIIDFTPIPARVVATFKSNTTQPDAFGFELISHGNRFGECIIGVENNKFDSVIRVLKEKDYPNIYFTEIDETRAGLPPKTRYYGWNTNSATKYTMLNELKTAVEDGLLELSDPDLIAELKSYSRDDLMDRDEDVRLTTRHFDLLISCFVKGTLVLTDKGQTPIELLRVGDLVMTRKGYKKIISTRSVVKPVINNIGLTGTPDHPIIMADDSIKELTGVSHSDNIYIWDSNLQKIEKLSYIKALPIIATLMHQNETIECISRVGQNGRSPLSTYIDKFGLIIMVKYLKVFMYIIKMVTPLITRLVTLKYYQALNTCVYICKKLVEKMRLDSLLKIIEKKLMPVSEKVLKIEQCVKHFVYLVSQSLIQSLRQLSTALGLAPNTLLVKKRKNHQYQEHATFVTNSFSPVYHIKRDVQSSVTNYDEGKNLQRVYNIEVEDQPEYFANGILVHNCAIAWQMRKWAVINKPKTAGYVQPGYQRAGLED